MRKVRNSFFALAILFIYILGIYFGYFQDNNGLSNIGVFATWFWLAIFLLGSFQNKNANSEYQNLEPFIAVRYFSRFVVFLSLIVFAYLGNYFQSIIVVVYLIAKMPDLKDKK